MNGTTSMPQVQARVTGGCLQVALHELLSALNFVWIQTRQVSWTGLPLVEGRHVKSANILSRYPGRNSAYRPCMHGRLGKAMPPLRHASPLRQIVAKQAQNVGGKL